MIWFKPAVGEHQVRPRIFLGRYVEADGRPGPPFRHSGLRAEEIPFHQMGWAHYLPRLEMVAIGEDPGGDSGPG